MAKQNGKKESKTLSKAGPKKSSTSGLAKLESKNTKAPFYIVGIGASAGGLEALEAFFNNCPNNSDVAYVVIQHLSPDYKSLMTELLSRHTNMEVREAKDNDVVKPNNVYLIPRNKNLTLQDGMLKLAKRPAKTQLNFSIDIFFYSLAAAQKEMSIGIILSGTGSDGTRGGKAIKEVGGTIFVQDPASGKFDGMTRSAIHHGLADYVLSPAEIPSELMQFISHPHFTKTLMTGSELAKDIESMDRVLKVIKNHTGYDFFSYKKPTLLRRTAKRMNITKCETIEDYIDYLYQTTDEKAIIVEEFLIGVTKFFRDSEAYDILEKMVIPDIIDAKKDDGIPIKIWVVACSTGEEAYSLAILFEEYLEERNLKLDYKIFATDIDSNAIDTAAKGIYSSNISLDISAKRLSKYFAKNDDKFQIKPRIRKKIIFSKHDILTHPPFNKMDLVSCRNMLIYIDNPNQTKILASLHYSLNMNGYLFMGSSESIGLLNKNFSEVSSKWKVYRNIHPTKIISLPGSPNWQLSSTTKNKPYRSYKSNNFDDKVIKALNSTLLEEYNAVSVCVDKNFEILHASGRFKEYIEIPDEGFSNNILKLLPEQLCLAITSGIRKLVKDEDNIVRKTIHYTKNEKLKELKLIIEPLALVASEPVCFIIAILAKEERDLTVKEKEITILNPNTTDATLLQEVSDLKEALNETRENLQATIEELETSNEEMQATNEELLASNEELQSTNEELQSLNEELHTVNAELQEKNVQLLELNSDIENLVININIGTIFLDKQLAIRKFTPSIKEHFQLIDEDIGRPIHHFSASIGDYDLVKESRNVLKTLNPFKAEFQNEKGTWFMMQIFPYRTQSDEIRGVVVNFININELKNAYSQRQKLNDYITHLAESAPIIIYVYDLIKKVNIFSSNSIFQFAGYTKDEIQQLGESLLLKIVHPDDLPKIAAHHKKMETINDDTIAFIEYRIVHKTTREMVWILSSDKAYERNAKGKVISILGAAQNITEAKKMELLVEQSEERARTAIQGTGAGLWEWSDIHNDDAWWSPQFYKLLSLKPKNIKASYGMLLNLIHPDHIEYFQDEMHKHLTEKESFGVEIKMQSKRKAYRWFRLNAQASWDKEGKPTKVVGTLLDIDEQKRNRELIVEKQEKLEAIYANAPVGIILCDTKAKIMEVSQGFSRILGYAPTEIVGKTTFSITHKEDIDLSKKQHSLLRKKEVSHIKYDKRLITKDKKTIWVHKRIKPIQKQNGEVYVVAIISDINEQKQAEIKMKRLNEELERFAYLASHDLKEPLRTITSLTDRFTQKFGDKLSDKAMKYIDMIETSTGQMETLTAELLVYSQLGHEVKKYTKINLNQLIKQIKSNLQKSIDENKAKIEYKRMPSIYGDPFQIGLLLQNLISNSLKYRKKVAPHIQISCISNENNWQISVKDNGIGIDKEYHDRIFEVFRRLHNKSEYEGTGIGLANCKRIIDNHKGKIWVKSSPKRGATFIFTLPKQK